VAAHKELGAALFYSRMNEPDCNVELTNQESHCVCIRDRYFFRCGALKQNVNGKSLLQFGKDARPADIPLALWGGVGAAVLTPRARYSEYFDVYLCFTMILAPSFVFLLSVLQEWDLSLLVVVLGTLYMVATAIALLLWEQGTKHFDLEVHQLVTNSLQSHALDYGWDLIYDFSCTKTNHKFLEFKKLPIAVTVAPEVAEPDLALRSGLSPKRDGASSSTVACRAHHLPNKNGG
jgi:hypothetical protein